jgi:uncharacterized protein (DUF305 family)
MTTASRFAILVVFLVVLVMQTQRSAAQMSMPATASNDLGWSELQSSMAKMDAAMATVSPSGNSDADFVKMMVPHHQAAIDMAKTELLYGKDPQMRRLAQEIITDQQSEIELMQLWLKQHGPAPSRESQTTR